MFSAGFRYRLFWQYEGFLQMLLFLQEMEGCNTSVSQECQIHLSSVGDQERMGYRDTNQSDRM